MAVVLRRLAGPKAQFFVDVPAERTAVLLQPGHAEQVLLNLVVNARDAIADGGRIDVHVSVDHAHEPPRIALAVSDDGVGMPEDVAQRAMEPFFTTKGDRGTGLGLALVYGIAQQSDGEVVIDSRPQQGTRITVSWPEAEGTAEESEGSRILPSPTVSRVTVSGSIPWRAA